MVGVVGVVVVKRRRRQRRRRQTRRGEAGVRMVTWRQMRLLIFPSQMIPIVPYHRPPPPTTAH